MRKLTKCAQSKLKRRHHKRSHCRKRLVPWKFLLSIASSTIIQGFHTPKQTALQSVFWHLVNSLWPQIRDSLWKILQRNCK